MSLYRYRYNQPFGGPRDNRWSAALRDGLVAIWPFNGNALDGIGGHDLTEVNSPGYPAGHVYPKAIDFETDNLQYCQVATSTELQPNGKSWMVSGWIKGETFSGTKPIYQKDRAIANGVMAYMANTTAAFLVRNDNGDQFVRTAATFGALSTGTWYFLAARYNLAASTFGDIEISVNAGTWDSTTVTDAVVGASAGVLQIGRLTTSYFDGTVGPLQVHQSSDGDLVYAMTDDGVDDLYNGGAGLPYP